MAGPKSQRKGNAPTAATIAAARPRVREIITAIAAEVIAETVARVGQGQKPRAAALRIAAGRRSLPKRTKAAPR